MIASCPAQAMTRMLKCTPKQVLVTSYRLQLLIEVVKLAQLDNNKKIINLTIVVKKLSSYKMSNVTKIAQECFYVEVYKILPWESGHFEQDEQEQIHDQLKQLQVLCPNFSKEPMMS